MTRKHLVALAAALRNARLEVPGATTSTAHDQSVAVVARHVAAACARYNLEFNWARFLDAAGVRPPLQLDRPEEAPDHAD